MLLTSQVEGTKIELSDLLNAEAGFAVGSADDVAEVSNCLRASRWGRYNLHDTAGLPIGVQLLCDVR